ncbi:hypothetical protein WN943_020110 [Citrus x changshan-huyou]
METCPTHKEQLPPAVGKVPNTVQATAVVRHRRNSYSRVHHRRRHVAPLFIIIGPGCCLWKLGFATIADALHLLPDRSQFDLDTAPSLCLLRSLSLFNSIHLHLRFGRMRPNDWINL